MLALVREWPDLRNAAEAYRVTLPILRDAASIAAPVAMDEEQVKRKRSGGEPLLRGVALHFDNRASRDLLLRLARGLSGAGVEGMSRIRSALEEDRLIPAELLRHVVEGDHAFVFRRAEKHVLAPSLLWTLAQSALKPALRAWCRELEPLARGAVAWEKATCYVCGTLASLGELQGNEQAAHLRCGQCGADWPTRRLRCVYCGNEDTASLGILYPEERRDKVRVEVCDACRGYLKVVTTFSPASPEELTIEDLSTLYLDEYARKRGYLRPTG
ncbi:MAG: formate dehydrogenase accessory protein FdhE [Deltaproteobacteria bacterium]